MKSILKFGIATVLALTPAALFAATGDAIFFSTSATNPFANVVGTTTTFSSPTGSIPLYIWVTSNSETTALTPASTAINGVSTPAGSAAMALNALLGGAGAGTGLSITSAAYDTPSYTGGFARWSAVTTSPVITGGTSFTNFEANTAMQDPNGTTYPAGTVTGLSSLSVGDPLRFAATVPGGLQFAWKVGTVNLTATAGGSYTLALSAGTLGVTKGPGTGGPNTTTDLAAGYSFGTANITISAGRTGDINGDGNINAADIDLMSAKLLAGGLPYDTKYDYRGPTAPPFTPDGLVSQPDKDRLVGSLIDINGVPTSVGTHYGDANLDGIVNFGDYLALLNNFGGTPKGWAQGDFNGDATVNFGDYLALLNNFGQTGGTGQVSVVPEPISFVSFGLGFVGLIVLRRRSSIG
jgi:hypothetical protein